MIHIQELFQSGATPGFRLSFVDATLTKTVSACCVCISEELPSNHRENRPGLQEKIARRLLSGMGNYSAFRIDHASNNNSPVTVHKSRLGRPILALNGMPGPSISFSYHNSKVWGAMCEIPHQCGIDVASSSEFDEKFPLQKIFLPKEITEAIQFAGSIESALALLWSAKESVVKAAGCGFHLIDPIEVCLEFIHNCNDVQNMNAHIRESSNPARSHRVSDLFKVGSFRHDEEWISVALRDARKQSSEMSFGEVSESLIWRRQDRN
jgi:phosphopantetheinyl transferase